MKLSPPKNITFLVAVIVAVIGLILQLGVLKDFTSYAFWVELVAFVILALGNMLEGF